MSLALLGILNSQAAGGGAGAMTLLEEISGDGASGTVSFTNIPSTYKSLWVKGALTGTVISYGYLELYSGGSMSYTLAEQTLYFNGGDVGTGQITSNTRTGRMFYASTGQASGLDLLFYNYASSNNNKNYRAYNKTGNQLNGRWGFEVGEIANLTNPIDRMDFSVESGAWATDTKIQLWGLG